MAVDLATFVDNLKREVQPPGVTVFPDAVDADYEGYLSDSFWEMKLRGYVEDFTASGTVVTHVDGGDDIERDYVQLIIINAAMTILRIHLANIDTGFRAHAGPVEFETRKSANAIEAALESLQDRYEIILRNLPSDVEASPIYYTDINYLRGYTGDWTYEGY